jgi:hypothetical protein
MVLCDRDMEILTALCVKVRLMMQSQISKHWWAHTASPEASAKPSLRRLRGRGLLNQFRVLSRPLPRLENAVFSWQPGGQAPNPNSISWQLKRRWHSAPTYHVAYTASRRARLLFGGGGKENLSHPIQATHDAGLAGVYLRFLSHRPADARAWLGEDCIALGNRKKNPDAHIVGPRSSVRRVIEFGGSYGPGRVSSFHQFCRKQGFPYEIW